MSKSIIGNLFFTFCSALENLMMINKAYNMMRKVKDIIGDEIADDEYLKVR